MLASINFMGINTCYLHSALCPWDLVYISGTLVGN